MRRHDRETSYEEAVTILRGCPYATVAFHGGGKPPPRAPPTRGWGGGGAPRVVWVFGGGGGSIAVCAVLLAVGRGGRTFAPPVAFGLAGGILGLLCTAKGWGYLFPYALLCLGMRANNPTMELDLAPFLLSALCYTVAFTALSVWLAQKRDAAAE